MALHLHVLALVPLLHRVSTCPVHREAHGCCVLIVVLPWLGSVQKQHEGEGCCHMKAKEVGRVICSMGHAWGDNTHPLVDEFVAHDYDAAATTQHPTDEYPH